MKLFSAVLAAVFCASIISAAPSSSPPSSSLFFDAVFAGVISGIEETLNKHWGNVECVLHVIDEVVGESDLKEIWEETDRTVNNLVSVEWPKCSEIENASEQKGCKVTVVRKIAEALGSFLSQLASEAKWSMIKEIKDKISSECFENATFFAAEEETEPSLVTKGYDKFKCTIEAISEALKETEFAPIWEEYKKDLEQLHERIKACKKEPSFIAVAKCIAKELKQGHEILAKFFASLKELSKETYDHVKQNIKEKCF